MDPKQSEPSYDMALLHGPTEDGQGTKILRLRKGRVEAAEVRPARDGQSLNDRELVRLHPREHMPQLCDVEVLQESSTDPAEAAPAKTTAGPARVSNRAYRLNWERIYAADDNGNDDEDESGFSVN